MSIEIRQFPCLSDNYCYLLHDVTSNTTAVVDPPDDESVLRALAAEGWRLSMIVNTHWHKDHTGGNEGLRRTTGAMVFAPLEVAQRGFVNYVVEAGEMVPIGQARLQVVDTGGHTHGHVSYFDAENGVAFVGDTLFAMGCGRIFEGTAEQMWASLQRLADLPDATRIYCAHEYTEANARFALSVDTDREVIDRAQAVFEKRRKGEATVPTTIALERATNPFLRAPLLRPQDDPVSAFRELRLAKDAFKG